MPSTGEVLSRLASVSAHSCASITVADAHKRTAKHCLLPLVWIGLEAIYRL